MGKNKKTTKKNKKQRTRTREAFVHRLLWILRKRLGWHNDKKSVNDTAEEAEANSRSLRKRKKERRNQKNHEIRTKKFKRDTRKKPHHSVGLDGGREGLFQNGLELLLRGRVEHVLRWVRREWIASKHHHQRRLGRNSSSKVKHAAQPTLQLRKSSPDASAAWRAPQPVACPCAP